MKMMNNDPGHNDREQPMLRMTCRDRHGQLHQLTCSTTFPANMAQAADPLFRARLLAITNEFLELYEMELVRMEQLRTVNMEIGS